jgi:hypothetical protein
MACGPRALPRKPSPKIHVELSGLSPKPKWTVTETRRVKWTVTETHRNQSFKPSNSKLIDIFDLETIVVTDFYASIYWSLRPLDFRLQN